MAKERDAARLTSLLVILMMYTMTALAANADVNKEVHPLQLIKQNVERIKSTWLSSSHRNRRHIVTKRSANIREDALLLRSVGSYCKVFTKDPEIVRFFSKYDEEEPLASRDLSGSSKFIPGDSENLKVIGQPGGPSVVPVHVKIQRDRGTLWVLFNVAHSEPAVVARVDTFQLQKQIVEMPEDSCHTVLSQVRFEVPKNCDRKTKFQFSSASNSDFTVTTVLDLCQLSHRKERTRIISDHIFSSSQTKFKNLHFSALHIYQIPDDSNNYINITADIGPNGEFSAKLTVLDEAADKVARYKAVLRRRHRQPRKSDITYEPLDDVFDETMRINLTRLYWKWQEGYQNTWQYLRLSIPDWAVPQHGARLSVAHSKSGTGNFVKSVKILRQLNINISGKEQAFPPDFIYFSLKHTFWCDADGDKDDRDAYMKRNCSVRCQASGKGISYIYISRRGSNPAPLVFAPLVLPHEAMVFADLGPASRDIEGGYRCHVVDKLGRVRTQDLNLYTTPIRISGRPRLVVSENKEMATLTCIATGEKNLNMTVSVTTPGQDGNPVHLATEFERNITQSEEYETTLSLTFPTSQLKSVQKNVQVACFAYGERGQDVIGQPFDNILHSYGIAPRINRYRSRIRYNHNNTYNIKCHVDQGKKPINVSLSVYAPRGRIDMDTLDTLKEAPAPTNRSSSIWRKVSEVSYYIPISHTNEYSSDGVVLSLTNIPNVVFHYGYLSCQGLNEFGHNEVTSFLSNFNRHSRDWDSW